MPDETTREARERRVVEMARSEGILPPVVEVGHVFERVPMRMGDGKRWKITGQNDHTQIRITAVPGGRRRRFSYVKVDPKAMGNGRADRGEHRCDLPTLARHYSLVKRGADNA